MKNTRRLMRTLAESGMLGALYFVSATSAFADATFLPTAAPTPAALPTAAPTPGAAPAASGGGLANPLNNISSLPELLNAILKLAVQLGSIALVFALVWIGFMFVSAQGNDEKLRNARSALVWTVIGGLVLLGAESISLVIQSTVGAL